MRKLFLFLILLGIVLLIAAAAFIAYIYPRQIRPMRDFRAAAQLYNRGDYVSSALQFEEMEGFRDSEERAKQAWIAAGDKSFEAGDLAQSRTYYLKGGASSSMLEKLDSAYYELGVKAYAADERVEAENCFSCISAGSSYLSLLDPVRISSGQRFVDAGDYDSAGKVFRLCSDESADQIAGIWLKAGSEVLGNWDIDNASYCFAKAMAYTSDRDSVAASMDELWSAAGNRAVAEGDTVLADKCFSRTSDGTNADEATRSAAYKEATNAYNEGRLVEAFKLFFKAKGYSDADTYMNTLREKLSDYFNAKGKCFATIEDGRVGLEGNWGAIGSPTWDNVTKVAVGSNRFLLGLTSGGTVLFHGNNSDEAGNVDGWREIVDIACGRAHSVGLKADGTCMACGSDNYGQCYTSARWSGIKKIAAGGNFTAGITVDDKVVACGDNDYGQCNISDVENAVAIACGDKHLVVLLADGTVVARGSNDKGQCAVSGWTDIVAVYAGADHTIGVRSDGRLVACGNNTFGQCDVDGINNAISISCGDGYTLVLTDEGMRIRLGH